MTDDVVAAKLTKSKKKVYGQAQGHSIRIDSASCSFAVAIREVIHAWAEELTRKRVDIGVEDDYKPYMFWRSPVTAKTWALVWERIAAKPLFVEVTTTMPLTPRFLRARSRWWMAYTLVNNPDLVRYRRYDPFLTADPTAVYKKIMERHHKHVMEKRMISLEGNFGAKYTRPKKALPSSKESKKRGKSKNTNKTVEPETTGGGDPRMLMLS